MKKQSRFTGLAATLLGSMVLLNTLDKPGVTALHAPDVLRLVAAGALLGIGFAGLIGGLNMLSFARSAKDQSQGSL